MTTITANPESTVAIEQGTPIATSIESRVTKIQDDIRTIQNSSWWSLFNTMIVALLLTATIICLTLPFLVQGIDPLAHARVDLAVRGLVALVLLFNIYAVWQQFRLKKLCDDMKESLKAIGGK